MKFTTSRVVPKFVTMLFNCSIMLIKYCSYHFLLDNAVRVNKMNREIILRK